MGSVSARRKRRPILVPRQLAWTFGALHVQPDLAFSRLHDGWNLTADLHVAFPITSGNTVIGTEPDSYRSGNEFAADYTVAKTIEKWTFGVDAHQEDQSDADTFNGSSVPNSIATNFGIGPLAGYQFGGMGVIAGWNHNIYTRNDMAGNFFVVPL